MCLTVYNKPVYGMGVTATKLRTSFFGFFLWESAYSNVLSTLSFPKILQKGGREQGGHACLQNERKRAHF